MILITRHSHHVTHCSGLAQKPPAKNAYICKGTSPPLHPCSACGGTPSEHRDPHTYPPRGLTRNLTRRAHGVHRAFTHTSTCSPPSPALRRRSNRRKATGRRIRTCLCPPSRWRRPSTRTPWGRSTAPAAIKRGILMKGRLGRRDATERHDKECMGEAGNKRDKWGDGEGRE